MVVIFLVRYILDLNSIAGCHVQAYLCQVFSSHILRNRVSSMSGTSQPTFVPPRTSVVTKANSFAAKTGRLSKTQPLVSRTPRLKAFSTTVDLFLILHKLFFLILTLLATKDAALCTKSQKGNHVTGNVDASVNHMHHSQCLGLRSL